MTEPGNPASPQLSWAKIFGLILLTVVLTTVATVWAIRSFVFVTAFRPVELSEPEERVLDAKLEKLERSTDTPAPPPLRPHRRPAPSPSRDRGAAPSRPDRDSAAASRANDGKPLEPEPYSEKDADREIVLTEREINALLARNTDLASKVAIDLADDLVSAKVLIPVDEDFPMLGGATIRVRAGLTLGYENSRPVVVLRGVSLMGVPIPSAWLGGIKNIDLVERYGGDEGFWKAFAAGVEHLHVEDGSLEIKLKE